MVDVILSLPDKVWGELKSRYRDKWMEHVIALIEKDLFGQDLTYWAKKKLSL